MISGSVVIQDTATPALRQIASQVRRPRGLMAAAGKRVEKELRAHFADLDRRGNSKGWPRSHFWNRRVRQATSMTSATETSAEVTIASPEFVHVLRGGPVTPKRGKFLAIPMTARAKAAGSPREGGIPDLFVIGRRSGGSRFLATREGGALRVHYRLTARVVHQPTPHALPPVVKVRAAIDDEAGKYFARETRRNAGGVQ